MLLEAGKLQSCLIKIQVELSASDIVGNVVKTFEPETVDFAPCSFS